MPPHAFPQPHNIHPQAANSTPLSQIELTVVGTTHRLPNHKVPKRHLPRPSCCEVAPRLDSFPVIGPGILRSVIGQSGPVLLPPGLLGSMFLLVTLVHISIIKVTIPGIAYEKNTSSNFPLFLLEENEAQVHSHHATHLQSRSVRTQDSPTVPDSR